jgi:predicted negative regulator of RcsB-dependent stress response
MNKIKGWINYNKENIIVVGILATAVIVGFIFAVLVISVFG